MQELCNSEKNLDLDKKILQLFPENTQSCIRAVLDDPEIQALHEYAHIVSTRRMQINDHGPYHMKQVVLNALKIAHILHEADIPLTLEDEGMGSFEDSRYVLFFATLLHDVGMAITRDMHETYAPWISDELLRKYLGQLYPDQIKKQTILRMLINECIIGHMGAQKIFSKEAGIILIADGCDMQKSRAFVPLQHQIRPQVGDIHKYSAATIETITIQKGELKPIHINIKMSDTIGLFQIEAVLFPKLDASTITPYIMLTVNIADKEVKRYL